MTTNTDLNDYACSSCGRVYLPYKKDLPCPGCGKPSKEYFDIIPKIVESLIANKKKYGSFEPAFYHAKSHFENIQDAVFHIFDRVDEEAKKGDLLEDEKRVLDVLANAFTNRPEYNFVYLKDIIFAVYKAYKEEINHTKK